MKQVSAPFSLVLTFVPPQGKETKEAQAIADQLGSSFCPVLIGNRKAFFRAQSKGQAVQEFEPGGKAADEIKALYNYTMKQLKGQGAEDGKRKLA